MAPRSALSKLCIPMLTRLIPASYKQRSFAASIVAGDTSKEQAVARRSICRSSRNIVNNRCSWSIESSDGVPPPSASRLNRGWLTASHTA